MNKTMEKGSFAVWRSSGIIRGFCAVACLSFVTVSDAAPKFRLPLSSDTTTHYYYDNDTSGGVKDWKCGGASYNGHRGTDFSGGPRGRAIFAGAVGTLEYKIDGFGDGYVGSPDGGGAGNYVRLGHTDNYKSYYFHMTAGSVTSRGVGASIACGEQVGGVGTSGSSSGLHLHFEVRISGTSDDPYSGACGGPISFWVNQGSGSPSTTCAGSTGKTAVIRDNPSATYVGTWATSTGSADKYGADYRYKSTAPTSEPATWTATLNVTAAWNVRAWWPAGANRSATAPYIVTHAGGSTTVNKNQQVNGGSWQLLGTWNMNAGSNQVKLSCWTTTGYVVVADAIKWD
jgi:murein DD-endopeptidase MepM/ murein hydrolase activator NlpD